jgi:hypothetical protein
MTDMEHPLVDINKASEEELIAIKGIGPGLANKIINGRPYQEIPDLVSVPGINEMKLASLLPFLSLEKKKTKAVLESTPGSKEEEPITKVGHTEGFVFLEDRNERQDAFLMILGGFILGLIILYLRRD